MPHFFFNYISGGASFVDDVGTDFPSLEAAYLDTCKSALAISFEKLRARQDPTADAFEIIDDKRNVLMRVPFSEVLRPAAATRSSAVSRQTALAFENCFRLMERNEKLKGELCAEIARAKEAFHAIRTNLFSPGPV